MAIFARIGRLFRGWFGLAVSNVEDRNPEALMEFGADGFPQPHDAVQPGPGRMAGVAEQRLKVQIRTKTQKAQDLERRILANHTAGNMEWPGAGQLQDLKAYLTTDTQELSDTEEAYQANLRQAQTAQKEFEEKISRLNRQLSQVKVKEAQAEASML